MSNFYNEMDFLFSRVLQHPITERLKKEEKEEISNLTAKEILKRWVNSNLENNLKISNFSSDFQDGTILLKLLSKIFPEEYLSPFWKITILSERLISLLQFLERNISYQNSLPNPLDILNGNETQITQLIAIIFLWKPYLSEFEITTGEDSDSSEIVLEFSEQEQEVENIDEIEFVHEEETLGFGKKEISKLLHFTNNNIKIIDQFKEYKNKTNSIISSAKQIANFLEISQKDSIQKLNNAALLSTQEISFRIQFVSNSIQKIIQSFHPKPLSKIFDENTLLKVTGSFNLGSLDCIINTKNVVIKFINEDGEFIDPNYEEQIFASIETLFNNIIYGFYLRNSIARNVLLSLFEKKLLDISIKEPKDPLLISILEKEFDHFVLSGLNFKLISEMMNQCFNQIGIEEQEFAAENVLKSRKYALGKTLRLIIKEKTSKEFLQTVEETLSKLREQTENDGLSEIQNEFQSDNEFQADDFKENSGDEKPKQKQKQTITNDLSLFRDSKEKAVPLIGDYFSINDIEFLIIALNPQNCQKFADKLSQSLFEFLEQFGLVLPFLKFLLSQEVLRSNDPNQIFVEKNFSVKILSMFSSLYGKKYLKDTLFSPINELCSSQLSFEIDQEIEANETNLEQNVVNTRKYYDKITDAIFISLKKIPPSFSHISSHIYREIHQKFSDESISLNAVNAFIIKNFFIPAILSPYKMNVVDVDLSEKACRGLEILGKIISNLFEGKLFESELKGLSIFNEDIEANLKNRKKFLETLSSQTNIEISELYKPYSNIYQLKHDEPITSTYVHTLFEPIIKTTKTNQAQIVSDCVSGIQSYLPKIANDFHSSDGIYRLNRHKESLSNFQQEITEILSNFSLLDNAVFDIEQALVQKFGARSKTSKQVRFTSDVVNEDKINQPQKAQNVEEKKPEKMSFNEQNEKRFELWEKMSQVKPKKESFMRMRSTNLKKRKRFVVMKRNMIALFDDKSADRQKPVDVILINSSISVTEVSKKFSKQMKFIILETIPKKNDIHFTCDGNEFQDWISLIKEAQKLL